MEYPQSSTSGLRESQEVCQHFVAIGQSLFHDHISQGISQSMILVLDLEGCPSFRRTRKLEKIDPNQIQIMLHRAIVIPL